jgi:hypothetical protein
VIAPDVLGEGEGEGSCVMLEMWWGYDMGEGFLNVHYYDGYILL